MLKGKSPPRIPLLAGFVESVLRLSPKGGHPLEQTPKESVQPAGWAHFPGAIKALPRRSLDRAEIQTGTAWAAEQKQGLVLAQGLKMCILKCVKY